MTITIIQKSEGRKRRIDIQVNEDQKIIDTLQVLFQAGLFHIEDLNLVRRIYSERNRQFVNTQLTYKQALIFNGDILVDEGEERGDERQGTAGDCHHS